MNSEEYNKLEDIYIHLNNAQRCFYNHKNMQEQGHFLFGHAFCLLQEWIDTFESGEKTLESEK